jgi:hypothetical protein
MTTSPGNRATTTGAARYIRLRVTAQQPPAGPHPRIHRQLADTSPSLKPSRKGRDTMRHKGKTIISILLAAAVALGVAPAPAAAAELPPTTIPAIQQWAAGSGSYLFTTTSRVVTSTGSLQTAAGLLAADLRSITGYTVPVATGTPAPGDIVLTTGSFGSEGYRLTLTSTATISGTTAGVFYGTQTLLQMLKQNLTLPQGTADDAPVYPSTTGCTCT